MATVLILAMMSQFAPAPTATITCDLLAVPVLCDAQEFDKTVPLAETDDLCGSGDFIDNCRRYAMDACNMNVTALKATVSGSKATCTVTCANQSLQKKKSCEISNGGPIARCIFPACPPGCLSCVDLNSNATSTQHCRRVQVQITDDPDPIGRAAARHRALQSRPVTRWKWVCE